MPRLPRLNLPDIPQHIVQRGNNQQASFFCEQYYTVCFDKLKKYGKKFNVAIHAYVLMINHVHLLMTSTLTAKSWMTSYRSQRHFLL